jgi:hypothetical protein
LSIPDSQRKGQSESPTNRANYARIRAGVLKIQPRTKIRSRNFGPWLRYTHLVPMNSCPIPVSFPSFIRNIPRFIPGSSRLGMLRQECKQQSKPTRRKEIEMSTPLAEQFDAAGAQAAFCWPTSASRAVLGPTLRALRVAFYGAEFRQYSKSNSANINMNALQLSINNPLIALVTLATLLTKCEGSLV